jgi:hypothetical protein
MRLDGAWTPLVLWGACNGAGPRRAIRVQGWDAVGSTGASDRALKQPPPLYLELYPSSNLQQLPVTISNVPDGWTEKPNPKTAGMMASCVIIATLALLAGLLLNLC